VDARDNIMMAIHISQCGERNRGSPGRRLRPFPSFDLEGAQS